LIHQLSIFHLFPPFSTPEFDEEEEEGIDIDPATGEVLQNTSFNQPPGHTDTPPDDTTDKN